MTQQLRDNNTPNKNVSRASDTYPKYWGTLEGEIIKAIVSARVGLTWNELQEKTNSDKASLDKALSKLYDVDAVFKMVTGFPMPKKVVRK